MVGVTFAVGNVTKSRPKRGYRTTSKNGSNSTSECKGPLLQGHLDVDIIHPAWACCLSLLHKWHYEVFLLLPEADAFQGEGIGSYTERGRERHIALL